MTAPVFRAVDQHTGGRPLVVRDTYDIVCAQRDQFASDLADARGELDKNMQALRDLGALVAVLTSQAAMWHADRDEQRERADEWRDKAESYLATIDELQAEVRELRGKATAAESERDTAKAVGS